MKTRSTLIELLVVIAVIAILAALLLPALQMARDKATAITRLAEGMLMGDALWAGYNLRPWTGSISQIPHAGRQQVNILYYDGHAGAWNVYDKLLYDNPPFASYNVYTPGGGSLPIWRPWAPLFQ